MIDVTYFEAVCLLAMTPVVIYVAYWRGWSNGKREGYHAGRAIARAAVKNDR